MLAIESERAAFVRAICAAPTDDNPRLIFADWIDDHGDPGRAELIRVQCALALAPMLGWCEHPWGITGPNARGGTCEDDLLRTGRFCRWCALRRREAGLLPRQPTLFIDNRRRDFAGKVTFRRGFIEEVECSGDEWVRVADAIHWHPDQSRPCPVTAHPIAAVRLTRKGTYPFGRGAEGESLFCGRLIAWTGRGGFTCANWPGITFTFP
jgi:uncharacterized protein (TIGR02996 family)